ncbi:MAG TPA: lycopene cyclase domain-containing protein [Prolixibacteraceae bacterium]|nr:lycopene cyclase domain-containing protein [Prolixibacteraceae bacterium]
MEIKNFTYLILLMVSLGAPLALSFDTKVRYYKNLKYILPAILVTAIIFWIWDIRFAAAQVWSFNSAYTVGLEMKGLPIEEWLFFIIIPYACVFIYEVLKYYLKSFEYPKPFLVVSLFLIVGFALISYFFRNQAYTFLTFLFSAVYLGITVIRNRFKPYMTKFYFAYFVTLVPFMVVNGILTSLPVVEYNTTQILNIRILNIPVEDFSYFFLMLLMVITIYETLKESKYY